VGEVHRPTEDEFYLGIGWSYDSWLKLGRGAARRVALANENPLPLHVIFLSRSREPARRAGLSLSVTLLFVSLPSALDDVPPQRGSVIQRKFSKYRDLIGFGFELYSSGVDSVDTEESHGMD
jgi:hypothetical protein